MCRILLYIHAGAAFHIVFIKNRSKFISCLSLCIYIYSSCFAPVTEDRLLVKGRKKNPAWSLFTAAIQQAPVAKFTGERLDCSLKPSHPHSHLNTSKAQQAIMKTSTSTCSIQRPTDTRHLSPRQVRGKGRAENRCNPIVFKKIEIIFHGRKACQEISYPWKREQPSC